MIFGEFSIKFTTDYTLKHKTVVFAYMVMEVLSQNTTELYRRQQMELPTHRLGSDFFWFLVAKTLFRQVATNKLKPFFSSGLESTCDQGHRVSSSVACWV